MTDKQLKELVAQKFENISKKEISEIITVTIDAIVTETMENGKCAFGKVGTFKRADVAAKPARLGVKNALTGGTYDIEAKPARTKLSFSLSKSGKELGA
jgi:nucleoid DNA-binding protein